MTLSRLAMLTLSLTAASLGAHGATAPTPGTSPVDGDGDGVPYVADCDDTDAELGRPETWYRDADLDGIGGDFIRKSCEPLTGKWSLETGDCDDHDDAVSPDALDDCDGVDNDCDGVVDGGGVCPCDDETWGGHTYLFCDSVTSWSGAEATCDSMGYGLVLLEDDDENEAVSDLAYAHGGGQYYWTCSNDRSAEGTWACDGQELDYTNWNAGEPNDSHRGGEDCAVLQPDTGVWNDRYCGGDSDIWFVCESL